MMLPDRSRRGARVIDAITKWLACAALCGSFAASGAASAQTTSPSPTREGSTTDAAGVQDAYAAPDAAAVPDGAAVADAAASAQDAAAADAPRQPPTTVDDEVIVRGQTRKDLRLQIEIAENAVYARFNDINSTDDFDIHCRDEMLTGSRIPRRICQANFWRDAQADAGQETTRALQGAFAFDPQAIKGEAIYRRTQFDEEMRRLISEDKELKEAVVRLATLREAVSGGTLPAASLATASNEKQGDVEALPYDAALESDVRMGRDAWSHTLRQRTFTIAHLYGRIRAMEVKCSRRTERLRFELGAEWTLPNEWGACVLRVDAPLGTTFTLYEFH
jgi:hypothetical protein